MILTLCSALPAQSATLTVTSTGDDPSDHTTLRGAVGSAANGDVIVFSLTYPASIVVNTSTMDPIQVVANVTIIGPGASNLSITSHFDGEFPIFETSGVVSISGVTIAHAVNFDDFGFNGSAISNVGTLTLANCTIDSNEGGFGGAIYNQGTLTVIDSTISNNTCAGSTCGNGGGIENLGGTLTVSNSTFHDNFGISAGGIYTSTAGGKTTTLTNDTFANNFSTTSGGAVFNGDSTLTVTNSTFSGNYGGAISSSSSPGVIVTTTITNSLLSANTAQNCAGPIVDGGYNISDDGTCRFGTSTGASGQTLGDNVDAKLDPSGLKNNGGPTNTIALQSSSPAIDAIPVARCPATDQRGIVRPDNGGTACDIGAYEFVAAIPCTVTYNGTFKGNLNISRGLTCIINGTVTGNVMENGGGLYTDNATIEGNLQITGGGTFSMASTTVEGNLQIQNIPAGVAQNQICGTHVKGNLQLHNNGTAVAIGDPAMSCPGDTIGNDLQVNNNTAAVEVFDDSAGGNLQCQNNASITGGGDTAKSLHGQCASFF